MSTSRYILFPYTTLFEGDYRHLSVLLPRVSMLQVIRKPAIPEWAEEQFDPQPMDLGEQQVEAVEFCLKGYQEFADVHSENLLQASLSNEAIFRESCEKRYVIQGELRGKRTPDLAPKQASLIDSATFLEMALDLDEKERELELSYAGAEELEGEFRDILGIGSEEDAEEIREVLSPPLTSERANLSFMLPRRIGSWFQVFSSRAGQTGKEPPVLVSIGREAVEELIDPLSAEYDREGKRLNAVEAQLAWLPALDRVPRDAFLSLIRELRESGVLETFQVRLEAALAEPRNEEWLGQVRTAAEAIGKACEDFLGKTRMKARGLVNLNLTYLSDHSPADLWKRVDKSGYTLWGGDAGALKSPPSGFLYLSRGASSQLS